MPPVTRALPPLILAALVFAAPARASMADVLGMGARLPALAGAGSSLLTGPWAAHHNPAGLAFATGDRLSMGVTALDSNLVIRGLAQPVDSPVGLMAGLSLVRTFSGRVDGAIGFGLMAYALPDSLGHVAQKTPDTPFFLLYDNRTQRDMLVPALALRLGAHFALGLSLDVFAGLAGPINVHEKRTGDVQTNMFVQIVTRLRPTPSIMVRPGHGLAFSLTYHPAFGVPYSLDVDLQLSGLDMQMQVDGRALYTPHTLVLGTSWTSTRVTLALDVAWAMWSQMGSPFVRVQTRIQQVGLLTASHPRLPMNDSVAVRLGLEATAMSTSTLCLLVRTGYGYESPVVGAQSGRSNVFDGHKHTIGLGLGTVWITGHPRLPRVLLDLHFGAVVLSRLTHHKVVSDPAEGRDDPSLIVDEDENVPGTQITNPGYPAISGGGWIFHSAVTLTLELG